MHLWLYANLYTMLFGPENTQLRGWISVTLVTSLTGFDLAALLHSNNNRFSCLVKSFLSSQVGHQLAVQWYLPLEYSKRVLPKNKVNRFNLESSYTSTLVFPYLNCTLKTRVIIADFLQCPSLFFAIFCSNFVQFSRVNIHVVKLNQE